MELWKLSDNCKCRNNLNCLNFFYVSDLYEQQCILVHIIVSNFPVIYLLDDYQEQVLKNFVATNKGIDNEILDYFIHLNNRLNIIKMSYKKLLKIIY